MWDVWNTTLPCLLSFNSGPCAHSLSKKPKTWKDLVYWLPLLHNQISYQTRKTSCVVVPQGFEPQPTEPKSVVLPLHQGTSHHPHGVCRRSSVDSNNQMSWRWRDSNPYREAYRFSLQRLPPDFRFIPLACRAMRTHTGKRLRPGKSFFRIKKIPTYRNIDSAQTICFHNTYWEIKNLQRNASSNIV